MTTIDGIVDWNRLRLNEGTQILARLLRESLGVRAMILSRDGEVFHLQDGMTETVFDYFVETKGRWGNEEVFTFAQTCQQWLESLENCGQEESYFVETAPGFGVQIAPVRLGKETIIGAVIVGSFLLSERAARGVESIRKVLPSHLSDRIDKGEGGPRIVQLGREDRRWVDRSSRNLAEHIQRLLEENKEEWIDENATRFAGMLGRSNGMKRLFRDIGKVARTDSTILVTGENGTGKELVAQGIHQLSRRRHNRFIAINCAAIPGELIASELFGHVRGAFSGAHKDRIGLFEAADGGTLLLDEIGDMELSLQTKLLRVLQEGTFLPVGDTEVRKVNVRVLFATNCDLERKVKEGTFRQDLFYRVRVIHLKIPSLHERGTDIELLANHFLITAAARHGRSEKAFSPRLMEKFLQYNWPGNVRELENEVERLVIMSGEDKIIGPEWLSGRIAGSEESGPPLDFEGFDLPEAIEYVERKMILRSLQKTGWNKSQTARELGVSRRNLIRKVARYELEDSED